MVLQDAQRFVGRDRCGRLDYRLGGVLWAGRGQRGGVQIAQPDLAYCGGISEAQKIRTVASALGVNVIPHCWGTMLNLAAATHFLASGYREPGRAEDGGFFLELDRSPNRFRDELFEVPVVIDNATVRVPTAPGPGVVVDRSAIPTFRVSETETR